MKIKAQTRIALAAFFLLVLPAARADDSGIVTLDCRSKDGVEGGTYIIELSAKRVSGQPAEITPTLITFTSPEGIPITIDRTGPSVTFVKKGYDGTVNTHFLACRIVPNPTPKF